MILGKSGGEKNFQEGVSRHAYSMSEMVKKCKNYKKMLNCPKIVKIVNLDQLRVLADLIN